MHIQTDSKGDRIAALEKRIHMLSDERKARISFYNEQIKDASNEIKAILQDNCYVEQLMLGFPEHFDIATEPFNRALAERIG